MEHKNEINDLTTRLARLQAKINSSLIVNGTTSNGTEMPKKDAYITRNDTNKIRKRY